MDVHTLRIAGVLATLPDDARVALAREILPANYAVVPRNFNPSLSHAFQATASRVHKGLQAELRFSPLAIGPCWQAMLTVAAQGEKPPADVTPSPSAQGAG